ncbi:MAG: hypothetical protein ABIE36_03065 [Candidatus Diapherotrites archaeon]
MKNIIIKRNKVGQFYLIATIIIAGLIIGFALINNYSSKKDPTNLRELAEELKIEGEKVLDYDILNSEEKFEEFSRDYSIYAGKDKEIYFILIEDNGNSEAYKYEDTIKTDLSSDLSVGENIIFNIDEVSYEFKKEKGKNFYFLVSQKYEDENYVVTN